ncbi:MAG TPA: peptidoglycan DD-metalloendopeptidase family protein [Devosiaceae bacterium]|jgi:septal ring factor EnvC (AmiA/AmiB activator)
MSVPSGKRVKAAAASLVLLAAALLAPALRAQSAPATPPADTQTRPVTPDAGLPATIDPLAVTAPPGTPKTEETPPEATGQQALDEIEKSISLSKDRSAELRREIEEMNGDRTKQTAALIAAGQRVKMAEIEVQSMEERLGELIASELDVRGRLDGADTNISNVLAALERISRNPPPALIVDPNNALGSARSAILIAAILPQLRTKADAVTADLKKLTEIKAEAQDEEAKLKANYQVLEEEQLRIATLIVARKQGVDRMTADLTKEEQDAEALAAKAKTLKDLVASLQSRADTVAKADAKTDSPSPDTAMTPEAVKLALANTARVQPAVPFPQAHGYLTLPAGGTSVSDFGSSDGFGGIAHGTSIVTRADAEVVAPADGWVMYKGPYLNYGQIVVINPGDDYTILLAGLDTTTVNIGQFVLMGEPLGAMGSRTIGQAVSTSAGNSKPTLYIELRKNNEPVDPTGWWANPSNPTQSG